MDASRPIPFDSPRRADSNRTLPDSGRHLPTAVSPFFSLLTSIAMHTLRNLYHSIPLDWRIPTHPVPMLSDRWLKGYPNLCTWVPQVSTFKLLATECYRHADTLRPISFNSPRRAEFNALCPDTVRPLVEGLSILLYFSSPSKCFQIVGCWVLQACEHLETYTIWFASANGLQWGPSRLWLTSAHWGICLFHPADIYSYVDALRATLFNSPRWGESNALCPTASLRVIHTFVLEFSGQVLSNC